MNICRLVYASSTTQPLRAVELEQLARLRRERNARAGVTGALGYHDGSLIEVLEGRAEEVESVFASIQEDLRLKGVLTMLREDSDARLYSDWRMGLLHPEGVSQEGVVSLQDLTETGDERVQRLLHSFCSIVGQ